MNKAAGFKRARNGVDCEVCVLYVKVQIQKLLKPLYHYVPK